MNFYERLWEDISKKDWVVPHNKEYLLFDVLWNIPSIERKVLMLDYESKSVYDIAKELSMTVARVKSLKSRGIEHVQTRLKFMLTSETYRDNAEYYGWDNLQLMELDNRYKNILLRKGYKSVKYLMCMTEEEILRIEGIGKVGLIKIKEALENRGLYLSNSSIPEDILSVYYKVADSIGDQTISEDKNLNWYREQIFERGPVAWVSLKLVYGIKLSTVDVEELKYRPEDDLREMYADVIEAIRNSWSCLT